MIGLRAYSARKTMDILGKVREIDAKSKGLDNPSTGSGDLMKELIFLFCTNRIVILKLDIALLIIKSVFISLFLCDVIVIGWFLIRL